MSLTTLADLKTRLGLSGTGEDDLLNLLIVQADSFFEGQTNRSIESNSYTEYYNGNGRDFLYLDNRPVTSITNLYVDQEGYYGQAAGAFAAATEWTAGDDFALVRSDESEKNRGLVRALKHREFYSHQGGIWPAGKGNIKVVYDAGYTVVPDDLQGAAQSLIALWRSAAEQGLPLRSEQLDSYAYELMRSGESIEAAVISAAIDRYSLEVAG